MVCSPGIVVYWAHITSAPVFQTLKVSVPLSSVPWSSGLPLPPGFPTFFDVPGSTSATQLSPLPNDSSGSPFPHMTLSPTVLVSVFQNRV